MYGMLKKMDKFKIGDIVKCTGSLSQNLCGSGWSSGYNFKIKKVTHHGVGKTIYWPGVGTAGVYEDSLTLIKLAEWDSNENR